jgi:hypothetical protein
MVETEIICPLCSSWTELFRRKEKLPISYVIKNNNPGLNESIKLKDALWQD